MELKSFLTSVFDRTPGIILITTLFVRVVLVIPLAYVSIMKFAFLPPFMQYLLGVVSVVALEAILSLLSLTTAIFRVKRKFTQYYIVLTFVVLLATYNSYLIQSITEFLTVPHPLSALLTLHVLNLFSLVLIESASFDVTESDAPKFPAVVYVIADGGEPIEKKIERLRERGLKTADIAEVLKVSTSTVRRAERNE